MGKAAETDTLVDILVLSKYTNLLYSDSHSDPAVEASVQGVPEKMKPIFNSSYLYNYSTGKKVLYTSFCGTQ